MSEITVKKNKGISGRIENFKAMSPQDKKRTITDLIFNNAMYIIIAAAIIFIAAKVPAFLSTSYR